MVEEEREKRSVDDMLFSANDRFSNIYIDEGDSTVMSSLSRIKRSDDAQAYRWAPGYVVGSSPYVIYFNDTYKNHEKRSTWLTPSFSNEGFEQSGVEKVFFLLLLVVIIGEFFASPAIALADSAIITSLGEKQVEYSKILLRLKAERRERVERICASLYMSVKKKLIISFNQGKISPIVLE